MEVCAQHHAPAALPPGTLGEPQSTSGLSEKYMHTFDPAENRNEILQKPSP